MNNNLEENIKFNREKIFEKLDYSAKPENYNKKITWTAQQQIAATNGVHYIDRIGKLNDYPQFELPIEKTKGLFLDIGCGWGRWLVSANKKGLVPVGIDLRLEFCKASLETLKNDNIEGYVVVADLEEIPFQNSIFDVVWSFSVIQHTHINRLKSCLKHINRILTNTGFTKLEFPNSNGVHNRIKNVKESNKTKEDYNSWCVRYYSINEYKKIFNSILSIFKVQNHSFLGIGVLKEDLKYVSLINKIKCATSLFLSQLTKLLPFMMNFSDSLYITAKKKEQDLNFNKGLKEFEELRLKNDYSNLHILPLLQCPITHTKLFIFDKEFVINEIKTYKYPIIDDIPILIKSEAIEI